LDELLLALPRGTLCVSIPNGLSFLRADVCLAARHWAWASWRWMLCAASLAHRRFAAALSPVAGNSLPSGPCVADATSCVFIDGKGRMRLA